MPDPTLIVGAGGFVGRALTASLAAAGNPVIAGVRRPLDTLPTGVEAHLLNYDDRASLQALLKQCGSVVYLAAGSTPISTAGNPLAELDLNLRPLLNFLEELANFQHIPLIYLSSAGSLYSGNCDRLLREIDLPAPRSYHGAGKIAAEHFIGAWCRQNEACATIIRPANIYGPGQTPRNGFGIIPTAFYAALRQKPITVRGDGQAARDYLYIDDLIALCNAALRPRATAGMDIFNAGTGIATSLINLLDLIDEVTGQKVERHQQPTEAVDAGTVAVDPGHATDVFGWEPRIRLRQGLQNTWEWFRERYS